MLQTFSIRSLGCKVNQYESQQVRELLQQWKWSQAARDQQPDLIILHTCCVTATASAKSRQAIRRLQKQHPHAIVVVCGCLPSVELPKLYGSTDNIRFVQDREDLTAELSKLAGKTATTKEEGTSEHQYVTIKTNFKVKIKHENTSKHPRLPLLTRFEGQARAFIKIQDGCDAHCAYCIIPQVRPNLSSKAPDQVLKEAHSLVQSGHREIVLTGVFLGAYEKETTYRSQWKQKENHSLCALLEQLVEIPDLERIRLSSLEPADVTPALLDAMVKSDKIMPHIHLSVQSGSDTVLRRMGRRYTSADLRRIASQVQERWDRPALTTDMIAGFPGESDTEFEETLALAQDIGFAKMHVFAFSPRAGTAAARMKNKVHNQTIQDRSRLLRELDQKLGCTYRESFLGKNTKVLIESTGKSPSGLSERYFRVYVTAKDRKIHRNELVDVKLVSHHKEGLIGTIASQIPKPEK